MAIEFRFYGSFLARKLGIPLTTQSHGHGTSAAREDSEKKRQSFLLARFRFRQPAAPQLLRWNAGEIRFDIENGRSIEHVEASDVQNRTLAAKQLHNS